MEQPNSASTSPAIERLLENVHVNRRNMLRMMAAAGVLGPVSGRFATSALAQATPSAFVQATPAGGPKGGEGTLIVSTSGDPLSFNPDFQVDDNGFGPCSNIYNKLVTLNTTYNLMPDLASAWEVAADGLTIAFHLVSGVTWHDGTPFTSADVKYTIEQIVSNASASASSLLSAIDTVDAPDDLTVVFNLKQPSASLLAFLGWYGTFILPAHIYEGTDWTTNPANQSPIGTGPFKFNNYSAGSSIELDANLDYWGAGPYVDKLVYSIIPDANTSLQAFLNGETDVKGDALPLTEVPNVEGTQGVQIATLSIPSYYYFGFKVDGQYTSDPEVRKAISQAIDREQIIKTALGGYGDVAKTYYPPQISWAANTEPDAAVPSYDPDAAKAVLDAKFPLNGDFRFKLVCPYFTASPEYGDIATVVKEQLKAVGIDIELVALEIGAWNDRLSSGDFDISILAGLQGPDPDNLKIRVGTGGSVNFWHYSNPQIDQLLNEGGALPTPEERAPKYWEVQQIMAQEVPVAPIATVVLFYPYADTVTGLPFGDAIDTASLNCYNLAHRAS